MTGLTQISAKDISSRWDKVTESEAAAIRNVESLAAQVAKSYSLDRPKADGEVKAWMVGRTF